MTRKRAHWGQTPLSQLSQLDAEYDPKLGQSDPIIC